MNLGKKRLVALCALSVLGLAVSVPGYAAEVQEMENFALDEMVVTGPMSRFSTS